MDGAYTLGEINAQRNAARAQLLHTDALAYQGNSQQLPIGAGEADMIITHNTLEMPYDSAWQQNWVIAFVLLVLILLLAALAFVFALMGWLKTTKLHDDVNDLSSVCARPDCIGIHALPISLVGGRCYILKRNFTLNAGEDGILVQGQHNIDLCYNLHEIVVLGDDARPLFITNSSKVHVYDAVHRAPTQLFSGSSIGIKVGASNTSPQSTSIVFDRPVLTGFAYGMRAWNSDVTVNDAVILATHPGGGSLVAGNVIGIRPHTMLNFVMRGGYISIPYDTDATLADGITLAVFASQDFSLHDVTHSSVDIEGLRVENTANGIAVVRADTCRLKNIRMRQDAKGVFGIMLQLGSGANVTEAHLEDIHLDCGANQVGGDCFAIINAESVTGSNIEIFGSVRPIEDVYRGSLLGFGTTVAPDFYSQFLVSVETIRLDHVVIYANNSETVNVQMTTGAQPPDHMSVSFTDSTITGGLVGVLMTNLSSHLSLERTTVSHAPWCYAAIAGTSIVVIDDAKALDCCICYFAEDTTSAVGVYNSHAVHCGISYLDLGTNNEFSDGFGSEGNNRMLDELGDECFAPDLNFPPIIILSDDVDNSTVVVYSAEQIAAALAKHRFFVDII